MTISTFDARGLIVTCPHCGQRNRAIYEKLGQDFKCGKCQTQLGLPGEPIDVTSEGAFDALIQHSALPVLVDFWASWCGPCKMVAPELVKVAASVAGKWIVAKVNTDEVSSLASRFQISAIPTMATFKAGKETARQAGAMFAPAIRQFMEKTGKLSG